MKRDSYFEKYNRAQRKVEKIRGFYTHFVIYIVINLFISGVRIKDIMKYDDTTFYDTLFDVGTYITWLFWGIGVALHAFAVFGLPMLLGNNWEENKIQQFMDEDPDY